MERDLGKGREGKGKGKIWIGKFGGRGGEQVGRCEWKHNNASKQAQDRRLGRPRGRGRDEPAQHQPEASMPASGEGQVESFKSHLCWGYQN